MKLPWRLAAPPPGWTAETDVVIVGSGIAGLTTALHITRHSALRVMLVTKDVLAAGSTRWAQGGIPAALSAEDSPEEHFVDSDGALSLTREGGHHRDRIAHAGGDATGAEIERALVTRLLPDATLNLTYSPSLTPPSPLAGPNHDAGGVKGEGER